MEGIYPRETALDLLPCVVSSKTRKNVMADEAREADSEATARRKVIVI